MFLNDRKISLVVILEVQRIIFFILYLMTAHSQGKTLLADKTLNETVKVPEGLLSAKKAS